MKTRKFTDNEGKVWTITDEESFSQSEKQERDHNQMLEKYLEKIEKEGFKFIMPKNKMK